MFELRKIKEQGKKESEVATTGGMISATESKKGFATLPTIWIYNKSLEQIRSFGAELGLSPSTRTRIKTPEFEDADEDLFTK